MRLAIHATTRTGVVNVHNGASAPADRASIRLQLSSTGQSATFLLKRADNDTLYELGIPTFLSTGGTWMVPGAWLGSSATTIAIAIYPEGPGAGKAHAHNTSGDYARVVLFNEKQAHKTATLGKTSTPVQVGRTSFGVTQFFSDHSCQLSVDGPQFSNKLFGIVAGSSGNVIASPNGKQAFVVVASAFRR